MIFFGFINNDGKPRILDELILEMDAPSLRELSKFIDKCAIEIEKDDQWEHEHFSDYIKKDIENDLVVFNAKKK